MISPRHRSFGFFNTKDLVLSKQYIMNGYLQQENIGSSEKLMVKSKREVNNK